MTDVVLTPREREVLDHAMAGRTVTETACRMGCSPRTVKTWRESIMRKLDAPNITAAVVAYLEPISRPQISRLRGVSVDSTVVSLVDRGLLEEAGRPADGGAMRYRTTRLFQERFGLRAAGDLPPLEGFELSGPEAERVRRQLVDAGHLPPEADTGGA